jgi:hypothetical protein
MADSVLEEPERAFLKALDELAVPFLVVGMSAALLEGATGSTQDIDLWFESLTDPRIAEAASRAGGVFISGSFGMAPPAVGGAIGDRFDIVTHADGLDDFRTEYSRAKIHVVDGLKLHVLPLHRIIVSKRAARRPKDLAALPLLEEALRAKESEGD